MNWNSLDHMVRDLRLNSDPRNINELKTEINEQIRKIHPNRSKGEFKSEEDQELYHRLSEALDYCENHDKMLIPLEATTALVQKLAESMALANQEPIEKRVTKASKELQIKFNEKYKVPKISLGAISAALGYVLFFPQTILEHPYLSELVNNHNFILYWFLSVFFLTQIWIITFISEKSGKIQIKSLLSLDTNRLVLDILRKSNTPPLFSRTQLRDKLIFLTRKRKAFSPLNLFVLNRRLDLEIYDEATDLAIERYLQRHWIRRIQQSDIDDWYEITI